MQRLYPPRMSKRPLSNPRRDQAAVASAAVSPTASAYFRNVSTDEQTTLASIAKSSIPTSDTLAHASMTIPLSRMRRQAPLPSILPHSCRTPRSLPPLSQAFYARPHLKPLSRPCLEVYNRVSAGHKFFFNPSKRRVAVVRDIHLVIFISQYLRDDSTHISVVINYQYSSHKLFPVFQKIIFYSDTCTVR